MMILFFVLCWFSVVYLISKVVADFKKFFKSFKFVFLVSIAMDLFICIVMISLGYMSYHSIWGI
ncbi:hypothetical protein COM38_27005 [Bacillus toyonensis]|nr:hypothetical protein COM38_27005 [Bacillus toyonensis]